MKKLEKAYKTAILDNNKIQAPREHQDLEKLISSNSI
jgi:hypothetical protein